MTQAGHFSELLLLVSRKLISCYNSGQDICQPGSPAQISWKNVLPTNGINKHLKSRLKPKRKQPRLPTIQDFQVQSCWLRFRVPGAYRNHVDGWNTTAPSPRFSRSATIELQSFPHGTTPSGPLSKGNISWKSLHVASSTKQGQLKTTTAFLLFHSDTQELN